MFFHGSVCLKRKLFEWVVWVKFPFVFICFVAQVAFPKGWVEAPFLVNVNYSVSDSKLSMEHSFFAFIDQVFVDERDGAV